MTQLRIEQSRQAIETVSESLIKKLYDTTLEISEPEEGEEDNAYISGHISVPHTYRSYVEYLAGSIGEGTSGIVTSLRQNAEGRFLDLRIDVTNGYYIPFEDPNMITYLNSIGIGSNGYVTTTEAASATTVANSTNTTVTKFNELRYFTSITQSISNTCKFSNWTALKEIDISNFTSLGNISAVMSDTFSGCTSLKTVTASNNLTSIGYAAFKNCSNLEDVTGLNGTITTGREAFYGCGKLKSNNFLNCTFNLVSGSISAFLNCETLTSISLSGYLGNNVCSGCTNLEAADLSGAITIGADAFSGTKLAGNINCPNLTAVNYRAFRDTKILKIISLGSISKIADNTFGGCTQLTEVVLPSSCTTLEQWCFAGCSLLASINVENVVLMREGVFSLTPALAPQVMYFKELLHMDTSVNTTSNGLFDGGGKYIYAPKLLYTGGGYDQGGNSVRGLFVASGWGNRRTNKTIVYFKDVASVETGAFCGGVVKHLVINNSTPPTVAAHANQVQDLLIDVSGSGNSVVQNVWVPDAAVNDYKNHTYWGEFGNKIQGLSGMSKVATKALWNQLSSSAQEDTLIEEYM